MNFIKRLIAWSTLLVAIDQAIKLFIASFMMEAEFIIIPHVFTFRTYQNINLGWIPNMLDFMMPLYMAVGISLISLTFIVIAYRYLKFCTGGLVRLSKSLDVFLVFALAAVICKMIDDIFWGGSLDYIQFFDWVIFDLKDVYLTTIAIPILLFIIIALEVHQIRIPKTERKDFARKQSIRNWIKLGFPMKP